MSEPKSPNFTTNEHYIDGIGKPELVTGEDQGSYRTHPLSPGEPAEITRDEFGAAYVALSAQMVGQLCRLGVDRDLAAERVQGAWANCWEKRHQLRDKARLSGWVMMSARNSLFSSVRRERRLVEWPDDYPPVSPAEIDYDALDLHLAIEKLPREQKQLMEMFIEGLCGEEIAVLLNTTLDGVYTRTTRARKALRAVFGRGDRKTPTATISRRQPHDQERARQA